MVVIDKVKFYIDKVTIVYQRDNVKVCVNLRTKVFIQRPARIHQQPPEPTI